MKLSAGGLDLEIDVNEKITRRRALAVLGTTAAGAFAGTELGRAHGSAQIGGGPPIEDFWVEGRKIWIRKDFPEYYEVTRRTVSPDLARRYGDPVVESTKRFEKSRHQQHVLPDSAEYRLENDQFEANMATEEEWKAYFESRRDDDPVTTAVSMLPPLMANQRAPWPQEMSQHDPDDDSYPMGVWTYSEDNGTYTRGSPINCVFPLGVNPDTCKHWNTGGQPADVITEFVNNGWTRNLEEYERFAWNRVDQTFESNQNGSIGNGSTATSWGRVDGGHHIRGWEWVEPEPDTYPDDAYYGRYASLQCHFDSTVPHTATGYECTQKEVESIFEDAFNWYVYPDYFDLQNEKGSSPDSCITDSEGSPYHNGLVTAITWGECNNVDSEGGADQHHEDPATGC